VIRRDERYSGLARLGHDWTHSIVDWPVVSWPRPKCDSGLPNDWQPLLSERSSADGKLRLQPSPARRG
jgi:hypothetical protein